MAFLLIDLHGKHPEQAKYRDAVDLWDSHVPMIPVYQRMLAEWRPFPKGEELGRDAVLAILAAACSPTALRSVDLGAALSATG